MSVDNYSTDYQNFEEDRVVVRALSGGTSSMRAAGQSMLPKEPAEDVQDYNARLERTFLFNAYGDAKRNIVSKIYSKPVMVEGQSDIIDSISVDADLNGRDITSFMRDVQDDAFDHGVSFILVDMPSVPTDITKEEEQNLNVRPYFVHVKRDNLIGWDFERVGGTDILTEIRIEETFYELEEKVAYGQTRTNWNEIEVNQIRVIRRDYFQIWRQVEGSWTIIDEGVWSLGFIPLVVVPTKMVSRMVGEPPLRDLAYLNVQHWQSSSDQRNILHVSRVPILFGKNLGDNTPESIGAGVSVFADADESDLKYVELSGRSIEAGREDIKDIEERMAIHALEPQISRTGNVTATSKAIDQSKANTQVEAWSLAAEDAIAQALHFAHEWMGLESQFDVNLNRDFSIASDKVDDAKVLVSLYSQGALPLVELLTELKRRGILRPKFDIEANAEGAEEELIGLSVES